MTPLRIALGILAVVLGTTLGIGVVQLATSSPPAEPQPPHRTVQVRRTPPTATSGTTASATPATTPAEHDAKRPDEHKDEHKDDKHDEPKPPKEPHGHKDH